MKKYLMRGMVALAFGGTMISCSQDIEYTGGAQQKFQQTYEEAFKTRFGEPASTQDWGFGDNVKAGTRSGNMAGKERVEQTSDGINANANEWADKADAPHKHGGWLVPPALTEEQKNIVAEYFQTHPNLTYDDPHFNNFFVQQVYKGDSIVKHGDTTEGIVAANGSRYASGNMNLLTVGANHQHINNFNCGTASTVNVLNNGHTVNEFDTNNHPDQIMLMVNIDDTQCMGYHSTGASVQRDDKAALVDYETIAAWADSKGYNGNCLRDGWNRSFVGFDLALYNIEEASTGTNAKFTDGQNSGLQYVWDGNEVLKRGAESSGPREENDNDITSLLEKASGWNGPVPAYDNGTWTFTCPGWSGFEVNLTEADWSGYQKVVVEFAEGTGSSGYFYAKSNWQDYQGKFTATDNIAEVAADDLTKVTQIGFVFDAAATAKIKSIKLVAGEASSQEDRYTSDYLLVNGKEVPFLSTNTNMYAGEYKTISDNDMKINKDGVECFNLEKIAELVGDGYLPVRDKNLREWVKFEYGDGYFSDWIVTLTEAKRQDDNDTNDTSTPNTRTDIESLRVIAEDLTVDTNTDFDFNDVVFDVIWTKTVDTDTEEIQDQSVKVVLQAAGGTLPLYVAGHEVHAEYGEDVSVMINTGAKAKGYRGNDNAGTREIALTSDQWSGSTIGAIANSIEVYVIKGGENCPLTAPVGGIASKIGVKTDFEWCSERQDIDDKYSLSDGTSLFRDWVQGILPTDDWYEYAKKSIEEYKAAQAALNAE